MTNYERCVLNAACILVERNRGEIHGTLEALADQLVCEMGGPYTSGGVRLFENFLMERGLEAITTNSPLVFFKDISGELSLVDRRAILEE